MTDLFDIFPDTSEPLSSMEEDYLENLRTSKNGWKCIEAFDKQKASLINEGFLPVCHVPDAELEASLVTKGFLAVCNVADATYIYIPDVVSVKTIAFHLPQIKMKVGNDGAFAVLNRAERNKQACARKLIAEWLFGTAKITDAQAAKYFDLYTFKIYWVLSCPDFLWEKLEQMLLNTDILAKNLTPEKLTITCRQCGTFFDTLVGLAKISKIRCPKCQRIAIVNISQ